MPASKRKKVPGSEKRALSKAKVVGAVDPNQRIEVTVYVRPRSSATKGSASARAKKAMDLGAKVSSKRKYVSREEFAAERGADPADLAKIDGFAHQHNLTVVQSTAARRIVILSGTIADLTAAFKPNLKNYKLSGRVFRGRTGPVSVPSELENVVVGVFGLDNRPAVTPHHRHRDKSQPKARSAGKAKAGKAKSKLTPKNAADGSFTPPEVAKLYNFPAGLDGTGQCIAIIELNDQNQQGKITGTGFTTSDLNAYFAKLNIPTPKITAIGVDGGANVPGPDKNADGEVMLDIEVAGAVAPGAQIAVYFAPNTDQGFLDAVNAALHDNVRKPSVVSISWGGPEDSWTDQSLNAFDQILQDAAALGITVCCSAGDDGSSDIRDPAARDGHPHVDFPASSPFALACGGTNLTGSGKTISSEVVWNQGNGGTGGGVSNFFARPSYQSKAKVPKSPKKKIGRGVPDIAGDADPGTGYQVRLVGGKQSVIGGTSAVSPLWAGLIARINQRLAKLGKPPAGFINPLIYAPPAGVLRDITQGNNDIEGLGKYSARKGWDPCTGLGTPDGTKVMQRLGG
jgi:kumamolisin